MPTNSLTASRLTRPGRRGASRSRTHREWRASHASEGGRRHAPPLDVLTQRGGDIKILLDGETDIKNGITYSRFETVPDAPITSFETVLPAGRHSVLGAFEPGKNTYLLCGHKLTIPTTITGQNGAVVTQTTKVATTGCPKAKKHKKSRKKAHKSSVRHTPNRHGRRPA